MPSMFSGIKDIFNINGQINNLTGMTAQRNQETAWKRDDTEYQRTVADMVAAGINPSMLFGGSGTTIGNSAPVNPSGNLPGLISGILGAINEGSRLGIERSRAESDKKVNDATIEKLNAEAENIKSKTTGQDIDNELKNMFGSEEFRSRINSINSSNANTEVKTKQYEHELHNSQLMGSADTQLVTMSKSEALAISEAVNLRLSAFGLGAATGLSASVSQSKSDSVQIPLGCVAAILNPNSTKDEVLLASAILENLTKGHKSAQYIHDAAKTAALKENVLSFIDSVKDKANEGYNYVKERFLKK